jgi:hypothetical protein
MLEKEISWTDFVKNEEVYNGIKVEVKSTATKEG